MRTLVSTIRAAILEDKTDTQQMILHVMFLWEKEKMNHL